ncbi:hypothetical protein PV328_012410, partial [Microctonus aethiopoides]
DHLNEVTAMYNGYKKILKNGDFVEISSPWAIVQFIRTEEYAKYWSAGIPDQILAVYGDAAIERYTCHNTVCDIVIIIGNYMLIIEVKHFRKSSPDAYAQVLDNEYCTLSEKDSVEKVFPTNTPNVE